MANTFWADRRPPLHPSNAPLAKYEQNLKRM